MRFYKNGEVGKNYRGIGEDFCNKDGEQDMKKKMGFVWSCSEDK